MQVFTIRKIYILLLAGLVLTVACEKAGSASADSAGGPQNGAGGSLARFAINGNYLYMVDAHHITVVDVTNPATPEKKNMVFAGYDIETIFSYKNKLYLGASQGMYIFSLSDPINPVLEGSVTHFRACDPVVSNDSVSYVTLRNSNGSCGSTKNVLNIYDVKNAKEPKLVTEVEMKSPYGLGIYNSTLFVCEGENGLVTLDLTDPYKPVQKSVFKDESYFDVIPYGDVLIAFIHKGVCFYDIADPMKPELLSKLKD
jgi:hypothetical protein